MAGNHDTYWRGPKEKRPEGEHDANYEMHFGPLWYAFEHKDCWFIALYSDEGNPETGEKNFRKAECQRMSPEQFQWLSDVLEQAADADHVFCFLHHPRWLGGRYGDDWDRVHQRFVEAGNVTAVFAGHIHRMRYDPRDGIEYVTLATVGGGQSGVVPQAGYLHQYHVVTVRKDRIALAAVPVGEVMDVREITDELQQECVALARQTPQFEGQIELKATGEARGAVQMTLKNTASQPIDINVLPDSPDSRWRFTPDHKHATVAPGESQLFRFHVRRAVDTLDRDFQPLDVRVQMEYLAAGHRYVIPEQRSAMPVAAALPAPPRPSSEHVLRLDGRDDCARLRVDQARVPDGPLTLECWFRAESYGRRVGLITKTENSEFGIFVSRGTPSFSVFLGDRYANARADDVQLETDRWYHVAGVYDGQEVRLYIDGARVAAVERSGKRRTNNLPLFVGADVTGRGEPMSHFDGAIDEVRLSSVARYSGASFEPQRRLTPDEDALLLLHMDGAVGPWLIDSSSRRQHPTLEADAHITDHAKLN